jgi:hypothetical protein
MAAQAVGLAVGRFRPKVAVDEERWPYVVLGAGFALYGMVLISYGGVRAAEIDRAIGEGRFAAPSASVGLVLTAIGIGLGLATAALIIAA